MTMPPQGVTHSSWCILPLVSCAVFKPATIPPLGLERLLRRAEQDKTAGRAGAGAWARGAHSLLPPCSPEIGVWVWPISKRTGAAVSLGVRMSGFDISLPASFLGFSGDLQLFDLLFGITSSCIRSEL